MVDSVAGAGETRDGDAGAHAGPAHDRLHLYWITVAMALVAMFGAIDRNILAVLLVPIQQDLKISDTAMGALTGVAFSVVYATAALPLARLADKTNRRNLLAIALACWSAMTALCALATSFVQLLLVRIGVAAAEAGQNPSMMSMLADFFPPTARGRAIAVVLLGSGLGSAVGAAAAGLLNDAYGWQVAMAAMGLPGILLAGVIMLTVPEPRRGAHDKGGAEAPAKILASYAQLWRIPTLAPLLAGMIFMNLAFTALMTWLPTFLMRVHELTATEASTTFGAILAVGVVFANLFAGITTDILEKRGARYRMYFCVVMALISAPLLTAGLLMQATPVVIGILLVYIFTAGGLATVTIASTLAIAPANLRASAMAFVGLAQTVVGGGLGPLLIGTINDLLKDSYGISAVRYTLLCTPLSLVIAAAFWAIASRTMDRDAGAAAGA